MCSKLIETWHVKDGLWILIDTCWFEKLYETWWIVFINLKFKLYRNIYIASLPCSLFVFVSLSVMIVFYTGADEVTGNKIPQWTTWDMWSRCLSSGWTLECPKVVEELFETCWISPTGWWSLNR